MRGEVLEGVGQPALGGLERLHLLVVGGELRLEAGALGLELRLAALLRRQHPAQLRDLLFAAAQALFHSSPRSRRFGLRQRDRLGDALRHDEADDEEQRYRRQQREQNLERVGH